jgi:hypothetical protein
MVTCPFSLTGETPTSDILFLLNRFDSFTYMLYLKGEKFDWIHEYFDLKSVVGTPLVSCTNRQTEAHSWSKMGTGQTRYWKLIFIYHSRVDPRDGSTLFPAQTADRG